MSQQIPFTSRFAIGETVAHIVPSIGRFQRQVAVVAFSEGKVWYGFTTGFFPAETVLAMPLVPSELVEEWQPSVNPLADLPAIDHAEDHIEAERVRQEGYRIDRPHRDDITK